MGVAAGKEAPNEGPRYSGETLGCLARARGEAPISFAGYAQYQELIGGDISIGWTIYRLQTGGKL